MSITFYARDHHGEDAPSVNMSNSNAAMVVRSLGLEFDYSGQVSPTDLLIAIACADPIDSGAPEVISRGNGGATMIDCAIRPGYHADRYSDLRTIARYADENGTDVVWA